MTFSEAISLIVIGPLKLLFDVVFSVVYRLTENAGLSICIMSLTVNFLVLPLYNRADHLQKEQRDIEKKLSPWVKHIKAAFHGDEQFMMLQTLYRENGYKPSQALKGSLSLLLEIPFFIAAYQFLSRLDLLSGVSFGPIKDLAYQDGLLEVAGKSLNILPFLMTAINITSGTIYSKGSPVREKIQLYGLAAVFLVYLYPSPSGLVLYWTLNNVFSLCKNIIVRSGKSQRILGVLSLIAGASLLTLIGCWWHSIYTTRKVFLFACAVFLLSCGIAFLKWKGLKDEAPDVVNKGGFDKGEMTYFTMACVTMAVIVGFWIPSAVVSASPAEFIELRQFHSPMRYVMSALCLSCGTFMLWGVLLYYLASKRIRKYLDVTMTIILILAIVDFALFVPNGGNLSSVLIYDSLPQLERNRVLLSLFLFLSVGGVVWIIYEKKSVLLKRIVPVLLLAVIGVSATNVNTIVSETNRISRGISDGTYSIPHLTFSTKGKNVVVLMMDRAISRFVPYIFQEKPELREQFDGFTYYPNTLSYGAFTNFGVPAVYGGYEYTPEQMNQRTDMSLSEKHNEALKVMPVLFEEAGYQVTVCEPTYAGYHWYADLSIYSGYPNIRAYLLNGMFSGDPEVTFKMQDDLRKRNLFCYSLFRVAPPLFQNYIYNYGMYNSSDAIASLLKAESEGEVFIEGKTSEWKTPQTRNGISLAEGVNIGFIDTYYVLENLNKITEFKEGNQGTFLMMSNDTPHEPMLLSEPEYVPQNYVDNTLFDQEHTNRFVLGDDYIHVQNEQQMIHYQTNVASLIQLGKWFDYLKENGVWDNTRIIVVSDHGRDLKLRDEYVLEETNMDIEMMNALFLVKDFGDSGFETNDCFMTNADTPFLAMKGIIEEPINPFTGNMISSNKKEEPYQLVLMSKEFDVETNNGVAFKPGEWYAVYNEVLDPEKWEYLGTH